jgi:hypothetical protein
MKFTILFICLLLLAAAVRPQNTVTDLSELRPMTGCWEHRDESNKLMAVEEWVEPDGRSFRGKGRMLENGSMGDWQLKRIEQRNDGIFFVSRPKENAEEVSFKLVRSYQFEVVFENMQNAFPKRITYDFSPVELTSHIEGTDNGKWVTIDLSMKRVKCGPGQ